MLGVSSPRKLPDALPPPLDTRSIQFLNVLAGWYKDREMAQLSSINHETTELVRWTLLRDVRGNATAVAVRGQCNRAALSVLI
jgi:hypothetical protein